MRKCQHACCAAWTIACTIAAAPLQVAAVAVSALKQPLADNKVRGGALS